MEVCLPVHPSSCSFWLVLWLEEEMEREMEKVVEFVAWWSHISEVVNGGLPWERKSSVSACNSSIVCVQQEW
jgi:hypothetical protein